MPLEGWDHLEFWVGNAKQAAYFYEHGSRLRGIAPIIGAIFRKPALRRGRISKIQRRR